MKLSGEKFTAFLKVMEIIGTSCDFMIIKDNKVRHLSNSMRMVFEVDLNNIFDENVNIIIPSVSQKHQLLEVLDKQQCEVDLIMEEGSYTFTDNKSYIRIPNPLLEYSEQTNPVVNDDSYRKRTGADNSDLIVEDAEIDQLFSARLSTFSRAMSSKRLVTLFNKDKVDLEICASGFNATTTVIKVMSFNTEKELEIEGRSWFSLDPILACPSPLNINILVRKNGKISYLKLDTTILEDPELTLTIWSSAEVEKE